MDEIHRKVDRDFYDYRKEMFIRAYAASLSTNSPDRVPFIDAYNAVKHFELFMAEDK